MLFKYRLYTPGPTSVPPETLAELAKPVVHHRTPEFRAAYDEVQKGLQYVFQTSRPVYIITGSGTATFQAGLTSCVEPGAKVLNISSGKFGERWGEQCRVFGIDVDDVKFEYGDHVTPDAMRELLGKADYKAVLITHSETSTGTACDLEAIAKVIREKAPQALIIVDGITSIGAIPFRMDDWGIDVAVTGSQKAMMLPPGLGFVSLSERALKAAEANKAGNRYYLDLRKYAKSAADNDTPFTPANTLIHAQAVSLNMLRAETLEHVWKRTRASAAAVRAGAQALGIKLFSKYPSDSVSAFYLPEGVTDKDLRGTLKKSHNIHVAGGQGSMSGQVFRLNHMGYSDVYDALTAVAALEHTLAELGKPVELGKGVAAAQVALGQVLRG